MNFISTAKKGSQPIDTREWLLIPVEQIDAPKHAMVGIEGILITEERIKERIRKDAAKSPLRMFFTAPSCVPATPFETAGAVLGLKEIKKILKKQRRRCSRGGDGFCGGDCKRQANYGKNSTCQLTKLGCELTCPFMTISFMALPVMPDLKLSAKGLFDVKRHRFVDVIK